MIFDSLKKLFFPPSCIYCGKLLPAGEAGLCDRCMALFEAEQQDLCTICGARQRDCQCYAGSISQRHVASYRLPVTRRLILSQKDQKLRAAAAFLGHELANRLRREPGLLSDGALITNVPRHPKTARLTGTDQAKELAKVLAKELSLPLLPLLQHKKKVPVKPQKYLDAAGRRRAAEQRYRFDREHYRNKDLFGKTVLLVDDVITTGATVSACAELLYRHGAALVVAVAPARADPAPKEKAEEITLEN